MISAWGGTGAKVKDRLKTGKKQLFNKKQKLFILHKVLHNGWK